MPDVPMGASIRKGDEVLIAEKSDEKDLSRGLGVSVDEHATGLTHIADVKDEKDLMQRSPIVGSIDPAEQMGADRLGDLTKELSSIVGDFFFTGTGTAFESGAATGNDLFAVQDLDWIDNPEKLSWRSALAAQLAALSSASEAFLIDPVRADFGDTLGQEDRAAIAKRAREKASELLDGALNEILKGIQEAKAVDSALQTATAAELQSYTGEPGDDRIEKTELGKFLKGLGR